MFNPQPKPQRKPKKAYSEGNLIKGNDSTLDRKKVWDTLEKAADKLFSELIRLRDSNEFGIIECCTCTKKGKISIMDCGHFMVRKNYSTRWEPMNALGQCKECNSYKGGLQEEMSIKIDEKFGKGTADEIRIKSKSLFKKDIEELRVIIANLMEALNELKGKKIKK